MGKYIVTGGKKLQGQVTLHGAKNAGFKAMIAALLAESPSTLCDLGLISEIEFAKTIITSLGGKVTTNSDPHCLTIDPTNLSKYEIPADLSHLSRFSLMYAGPLLAKFGQAVFPLPGGDRIARRPVERHIDGFKALGASVEFKDNYFYAQAPKGLTGTTYRFAKSTHNGTENLLLAAVRAKGVTILENAAAEPEVDNLIEFLNAMGAKIKRTAPRTIKITGVSTLSGATHQVMPDRNEAVTYACAALATRGKVRIFKADAKVLTAFLKAVQKAGGVVEKGSDYLEFAYAKPLVATSVVAAPYPAFMTDWQPLWATLMTQADGVSLVHETVYESRFDYVSGLVQMGAKIAAFRPKVTDPDQFYNFNLEDDQPDNPHAVKIVGPTALKGTTLEIGDIRSGATALLAGAIAQGQTIVLDPKDQIKRGYEDLAGSLVGLGADIVVK